MALDFPNSPSLGGSYTSGGQTWTWDGTAWNLATTSISNVAGGLAGQVPYQTGSSLTSFVPTGPTGSVFYANGTASPAWTTTGPTGSVLVANGSAAPTWSNTPLPVYTYGTRPVSGTVGQIIYLSDTDEYVKYVTDLDGTARWMQADHDYRRNVVINGGFDVWQRGTSFNPTSATSTTGLNYGADRWQFLQATTSASAFTRQAITSTDPVGFNYYTRVQRANTLTLTTAYTVQTSFESQNIQQFRGKYVTLSFWARAGANYSAASGFLVSDIVTGTGTDNTVGNFTSNTVNTTTNNVLTTSWKRFSITTSAVLATTITQLGVRFVFTPVGTAGAADYFDITGVMVEPASAPSDFEFRDAGEELRRCQRYFERYDSNYPPQNPCNVDVANRPEIVLQYQRKRTNPTITVSSGTGFTYESLTSSASVTTTGYSGTLVGTGVQSANLFFTATAWTGYLPGILVINSNQYIDISAEL